ncbi:hypothetical protein KC328_g81 [Hortaea werneckii]|nr:hypothetical protein KC328_g81 [Hortaea werneckii]
MIAVLKKSRAASTSDASTETELVRAATTIFMISKTRLATKLIQIATVTIRLELLASSSSSSISGNSSCASSSPCEVVLRRRGVDSSLPSSWVDSLWRPVRGSIRQSGIVNRALPRSLAGELWTLRRSGLLTDGGRDVGCGAEDCCRGGGRCTCSVVSGSCCAHSICQKSAFNPSEKSRTLPRSANTAPIYTADSNCQSDAHSRQPSLHLRIDLRIQVGCCGDGGSASLSWPRHCCSIWMGRWGRMRRRASRGGAGRVSTAKYPRPAGGSLSEGRCDGAWTGSRADAADHDAASRRRSSSLPGKVTGRQSAVTDDARWERRLVLRLRLASLFEQLPVADTLATYCGRGTGFSGCTGSYSSRLQHSLESCRFTPDFARPSCLEPNATSARARTNPDDPDDPSALVSRGFSFPIDQAVDTFAAFTTS